MLILWSVVLFSSRWLTSFRNLDPIRLLSLPSLRSISSLSLCASWSMFRLVRHVNKFESDLTSLDTRIRSKWSHFHIQESVPHRIWGRQLKFIGSMRCLQWSSGERVKAIFGEKSEYIRFLMVRFEIEVLLWSSINGYLCCLYCTARGCAYSWVHSGKIWFWVSHSFVGMRTNNCLELRPIMVDNWSYSHIFFLNLIIKLLTGLEWRQHRLLYL